MPSIRCTLVLCRCGWASTGIPVHFVLPFIYGSASCIHEKVCHRCHLIIKEISCNTFPGRFVLQSRIMQCSYGIVYHILSNIEERAFILAIFINLTSSPNCCAMVACMSLLGRLVSLNIACNVRLWISVNTSLGFLGPCLVSSLECDIISFSIFLFVLMLAGPTPTNIPSKSENSLP